MNNKWIIAAVVAALVLVVLMRMNRVKADDVAMAPAMEMQDDMMLVQPDQVEMVEEEVVS